MDASKNDTSFALAIVQASIKRIEAINPFKKNAGTRPNDLLDELAATLEAVDELKALAKAFKGGKAAAELRKAAAEFEPFATFKTAANKSFSGVLPQESVGQFWQSVSNDCMMVTRSDRDAAVGPPLVSDLVLHDATPEEISWYKWTLLVVLYAVEFALLYGPMVTIWNLIRQLGGVSFKDPTRIATEIGAAILVAMTLPDFQRLLRHILERVQLAADFEGNVDKGKEHVQMIATGILGGGTIDMGIKAGAAIAGGHPDKIKYAMFLGNFMAFFTAGLINVAGQMAIGRKLVVGAAGDVFPGDAIDAVEAFGRHYVDIDVLMYERLVHCLNWGCYEVYGGGLALLAKGAAAKEIALAGSLAIFVSGFKVSFYWAERLRARRAVDA
ncbi:hypothetical protein C6558_32595 [Ensifer sp. NM-2]|uniref:hypothetical protein n=1 Tax=Ensifer sp. NM-2 TaxID=2109730 RepID=UPI000D131C31|nr:hypothetical protein [Ensifer sp. NM-2]PSS60547.1 hypothetical protein C6558_32595 [Ensifer sp. NM-2]